VPDHDDTVSAQERVDERLPEEDAVRHIMDSCSILVADIFKADGVTDLEHFMQMQTMLDFKRFTSSPRIDPTSTATRVATEVAATRRG
jgi:hypothetical protein